MCSAIPVALLCKVVNQNKRKPERADSRPKRKHFRRERADSSPDGADFQPERVIFHPERVDSRANFRPEGSDFRPERVSNLNTIDILFHIKTRFKIWTKTAFEKQLTRCSSIPPTNLLRILQD